MSALDTLICYVKEKVPEKCELSFNQISNLEMETVADIDSNDLVKIENIIKDAIRVDGKLIGKLEEQYNNADKRNMSTKYTWNSEILQMFNPKIQTLFSHDLPDRKDVKQGEYIVFLDSV